MLSRIVLLRGKSKSWYPGGDPIPDIVFWEYVTGGTWWRVQLACTGRLNTYHSLNQIRLCKRTRVKLRWIRRGWGKRTEGKLMPTEAATQNHLSRKDQLCGQMKRIE